MENRGVILTIIVILAAAFLLTKFEGITGAATEASTTASSISIEGTVVSESKDKTTKTVKLDINGDGAADKEVEIKKAVSEDLYTEEYVAKSKVTFTHLKVVDKDTYETTSNTDKHV